MVMRQSRYPGISGDIRDPLAHSVSEPWETGEGSELLSFCFSRKPLAVGRGSVDQLRCLTQKEVSASAWGQVTAAPSLAIGVPGALTSN